MPKLCIEHNIIWFCGLIALVVYGNAWSQHWLSAETLNIQGNLVEERTSFVNLLNHSAITLFEDEDQIK